MKRILFCLLITTTSLFSESKFSIKDILDSTTFHYFIDNDGDYIVDYKTRTAREQQVIVRGNTNSFQNIEVREIISIGKAFTDEPVPEKLTKYLLIDNYSSKYLGNWAIHKKDNISTILFIVKLPHNSERAFLDAAIVETAEAADALEKALDDEIEKSTN